MYICMYHDGTTGLLENQLYNNDGTGYFTDVTESAGVGNGIQHTFQAVRQTKMKTETSTSGSSMTARSSPMRCTRILAMARLWMWPPTQSAQGIFAMTATIGDPDNDGDAELFCTNVENEPNLMLDKLQGPTVVGPA